MIRTPVLMLVLLVPLVLADDAKNQQFAYDFLAGKYLVIGKKLDSQETYYGQVEFVSHKNHLVVIRKIQGEIVKGIGKIETALADAAKVLRVRFISKGQRYEITYLWRSDLDNYARLSGYVYRPLIDTDSPGLEALFIDHHSRRAIREKR